MRFTTVANGLLLAGSAIAAPATRSEKMALSRAARRHSGPMKKVDGPADATNDTMTSYSSNWSGAVLVGTGYTGVTGVFTVPTPSSTGSGAAWVGIDGDTCCMWSNFSFFLVLFLLLLLAFTLPSFLLSASCCFQESYFHLQLVCGDFYYTAALSVLPASPHSTPR